MRVSDSGQYTEFLYESAFQGSRPRVLGSAVRPSFDVERSMFDVRHLPSFFLDQTGCFLTRGDAYMKLRCRVQSSGFWVQGLVLHSMFDVERSMFGTYQVSLSIRLAVFLPEVVLIFHQQNVCHSALRVHSGCVNNTLREIRKVRLQQGKGEE